jgi:formylglycine-generating enzyme required for sulfatase activity/Flp pilus assembly protein TadD
MEFWSKFQQWLEAFIKAQVYLPTCDVATLDTAIALDATVAVLAQELWLTQLQLQAFADLADSHNPHNLPNISLNIKPDLESKLNPECQLKLAEFKQLLAEPSPNSEPKARQFLRSQQQELQQKLRTTELQIILEIRANNRFSAIAPHTLKPGTVEFVAWETASQILPRAIATDSELRLDILPVQILLHIPTLTPGDNLLGCEDLFKSLEARLQDFCQTYINEGRPVELIAKDWFRSTFSGQPAITSLFLLLNTEPIVALESDVFAETLYLHLGCWGFSCSDYRYQTSAIEIDLRECLNGFAKKSAMDWWKGLKQSTAKGISPEQYSQSYDPVANQIFIDNLKIVEQEQKVRQSGMEVNPLDLPYAFQTDDFTQLQANIASFYCIILGLQLDEYFLSNLTPQSRLNPLLPQMLSQLLAEMPTQEIDQIEKCIVMRYQFLCKLLGKREPLAYPELCLDLAMSLSHLSKKIWAQDEIAYSVTNWLALQGISDPASEFDNLLDATIANATQADRGYLNKLNQCLTVIGCNRYISLGDNWFTQGISKYEAEDYKGAIADFTEAIQLDNLYVGAYLQRGQAYTNLGKYQHAIDDYSKAIELNPDSAKVYNYRGNAYRELGEPKRAIADYDRALSIDPNATAAKSDRQMTLDMLAAVDRQHSDENSHSHEFEYEVVRLNSNGKEINRRVNCAKLQIQDIESEGMPSARIEMVYIPSGVFFMGSLERESGHDFSEEPTHWVTMPRFFMSKSPITQAQWAAVAKLPASNQASPLHLNPDPSHFKGLDRPVESISWFEAVEFCARLTQASGSNYRLPSEAEWEYACRGGTKTPFHYGHTISTDLANYDGTSAYGFGALGEYRSQTLPICNFPVGNPFGLFDMHGQVWEWCADYWHDNYQGAPTNGEIWHAGGDDEFRIVRGGSWFNIPSRCRAAVRGKYSPDVWLDQIGFRIMMPISY